MEPPDSGEMLTPIFSGGGAEKITRGGRSSEKGVSSPA